MYGSLATVVILMLWFYLTAMAVLIGAEVNYVIEQAQARANAESLHEQRHLDEFPKIRAGKNTSASN